MLQDINTLATISNSSARLIKVKSAFSLRNSYFFYTTIFVQGQFSPEPCDDFTLAVASEIVEDEIKSGELEGMESRYLTTPLGGFAVSVIKF